MPTYRVWAKKIGYEYLDVEARDEDEAIRKAEASDDGTGFPMWSSIDDCTWEIIPDETEELDEAGKPIALGAD